MKLIFITPPYSIQERYNSKTNIKKGYLPPLGLAYIASTLERDGGHESKVIDLQVFDYTLGEIIEEVKKFAPDVVVLGALSATADKAYKLSKEIKDKLQLPIILGGPHVSRLPKEVMEQQTHIDFVIIEEAEYSMLELMEYFQGKRDIESIKGIAYRNEKGEVCLTAARPPIANLDELPIPSRKYFDMSRYIPLPNQYKRLPLANMMTTRGCSYGQCTFCFEGGPHAPKYRRISPQHALAEVKYLVSEYGIKEISFWDDEFAFPNKWVMEFCDLIKENNIDIKWSCYTHVNYITPELLKKMSAAGCWNIFYGLESGTQTLINKVKKGTTLDRMRKAVKWTHEAGIETRGSFILALPGETPELARETIKFAIELDLDYVQFLLNTPFPGTIMWDKNLDEGTLSKNYNDYSVFMPVFVPHGYKDGKEVIKLQREAYRRFYFRPKYVLKHMQRVKTMEDVKRYMSGVKFIIGMTA